MQDMDFKFLKYFNSGELFPLAIIVKKEFTDDFYGVQKYFFDEERIYLIKEHFYHFPQTMIVNLNEKISELEKHIIKEIRSVLSSFFIHDTRLRLLEMPFLSESERSNLNEQAIHLWDSGYSIRPYPTLMVSEEVPLAASDYYPLTLPYQTKKFSQEVVEKISDLFKRLLWRKDTHDKNFEWGVQVEKFKSEANSVLEPCAHEILEDMYTHPLSTETEFFSDSKAVWFTLLKITQYKLLIEKIKDVPKPNFELEPFLLKEIELSPLNMDGFVYAPIEINFNLFERARSAMESTKSIGEHSVIETHPRIRWNKGQAQLKEFHQLLVKAKCIEPISFQDFRVHFKIIGINDSSGGWIVDEFIIWLWNYPELIMILHKMEQDRIAIYDEDIESTIQYHFKYKLKSGSVIPESVKKAMYRKIRQNFKHSSPFTQYEEVITWLQRL